MKAKQSSPIKQFSIAQTISKEINITANTAAITFFSLSPHSFYFSFPCSFLGGIFGLILLLVFFGQKTVIFVRYVFKYPAR